MAKMDCPVCHAEDAITLACETDPDFGFDWWIYEQTCSCDSEAVENHPKVEENANDWEFWEPDMSDYNVHAELAYREA